MSDSNPTEPPQSEPLFPGGEYAIEGVLGSGGMAMVYRARDLRRPRAVAIKVLRADIAKLIGPDRFLREIAVTAGFTHPHILPLLDSGETTDALGQRCLYYVMPLLEGQSLAERMIKERRLAVQDAIRLTCEILEALRYAHEQGVIHRDIKPANVLLSGGHAVVADFGVARPVSGSTRAGYGGKPLTEYGIIVGTPEYMSPEQALGDEKVDERCDLYAVACVLYEMVVGTSPFDGATAQMIVSRKISGTFTPASVRRSGLPQALDEILAVALSADKSDRYASAADFLNALSRLDLRASSSQRAALRKWPRVRAPLVATIAGTVAVAGLIAVWQRRQHIAPAPVGAVADKARVAVLPFGSIAPDSSLDLVANALTSDLIDELARFPALTVISKNGVLPFRGGAARADSVARVLNVGSLVTGDMRRSGDTVRVTVRLIDGVTSAQLASVEASGAWRDVLEVRSNIIDSVTSFLRKRIGQEISAVAERRASSAEAWELLARAKSLSEGELARSGTLSPAQRAAQFAHADSLLKRAIALDPRWTDPAVQRINLVYQRANIDELAGTGAATALRRQAVRMVDELLAQSPGDASALFQRGRARLALWRTASPIAPDSLRVAAEADLRAAVTRRRDMAEAWNDLSVLLHMSGSYAEALSAAEQALKADAYLKSAAAVISRLILASLATARVDEARNWCERGRVRFPGDPRFWGCDLTIMGWTGASRADVGTAWTVLAASEARDSTGLLASAWGTRRLLVAAVAARAGLGDSARAIVQRVRATLPAGAPAEQVDYGEAHVQALLGHPELAIPLLERYLRSNPALRGQVRNGPWFASLRNDARFLAITAPQ